MSRALSRGSRIILVVASAALLLPALSLAQSRSYYYAKIAVDIEVNRDASVNVSEALTYSFTGEYHQAWRSISHQGLGAIIDVSLIDGETGESLSYSLTRLEKTDPSSWGKFTVYSESGATNVEWYYDLGAREGEYAHTWILRYTAHGAVAFYADHDELYWNIFTDYEVPVALTEAVVHLPEPITQPSGTFYRSTAAGSVADRPDESSFRFIAHNAEAYEDFTFAVGWQKGVVDKEAFWLDWLAFNWPYIASLIIIVSALIFGIVKWFFAEKYNKGRGTIIPEYAPPRDLRPAMAKLIATERLGKTVWPATIVDLAVRGYIKIIKEKRPGATGIGFIDRLFSKEGYRLEKLKDWNHAADVEDYERMFLNILFEYDTDHFSTIDFAKRMRGSTSAVSGFQKKMSGLEKTLNAETTADTRAYEIPLTVRDWMHSAFVSSGRALGGLRVFMIIFIILVIAPFSFGVSSYGVLAASVLISAIGLYLVLIRNPRLNAEGFLLRDDWLGFKLYLETAEKHRMQNLTPDLFEKYLPYAMIFGIEKKWAKAFDTMNLQQPSWYGMSGYPAGAQFGSSGFSGVGFSASAFSASFSTSFTSAFASSGASGGASGGGGGAGGGGGGGGGGAS